MSEPDKNPFEKASEAPRRNIVSEFVHFTFNSGKYWLLPLLAILLVLGVLILLGGTSIAPFIYTMF